jgi:hypothetical protein
LEFIGDLYIIWIKVWNVGNRKAFNGGRT